MRRVVVTGMGIVSSIGNNTQKCWLRCARPSQASFAPDKYAELGFRSQVHGAPTLDASETVDRRAMRFSAAAPRGITSPWSRRSAIPAWNRTKFQRAHRPRHGLGRTIDPRHCGGCGYHTQQGTQARRPFAVPKAMSSSPSATLATWFKIKGVSYSISSACATSNHCIGNAYELIQYGKQDVVFAGGCEELDWTLTVAVPTRWVRCRRNTTDTPAKASRAYDADRDGFVISAGAGVVVLEEFDHAKARGARIYGEVAGYGATSDGVDMVGALGRGRGALHAPWRWRASSRRSTTSIPTPPRLRSAI